jgi:hypothetical protein
MGFFKHGHDDMEVVDIKDERNGISAGVLARSSRVKVI